jgi:hypothetical protein
MATIQSNWKSKRGRKRKMEEKQKRTKTKESDEENFDKRDNIRQYKNK